MLKTYQLPQPQTDQWREWYSDTASPLLRIFIPSFFSCDHSPWLLEGDDKTETFFTFL